MEKREKKEENWNLEDVFMHANISRRDCLKNVRVLTVFSVPLTHTSMAVCKQGTCRGRPT